MLTQERLKELLSYDPATGVFRWRVSLSNRAPSGSVAGCIRPDGYVQIMIDGKHYLAHRLAWLYVHGELAPQLDHADGNPSNNRISNLRPATQSQNNGNARKRSDNTSGKKGVSWHKRDKKWQSRIKHNGRQIYLGYFETAKAAHAAYCEKARELFGEFWHSG